MRAIALLLGVAVALLVAAPIWAPWVGIGPPDAPAPGRLVAVGSGLRVNVFDEGSGPAVLLVHGLPGSSYDWWPLPEKLVARGYRVIRYDRIGYGHSDRRRVDADHHFGSNAHELLGLVAALDLERPLLVGWSYGGGVVQVAAQNAPERLRGLVLVGSVGALERAPHERGWLERAFDSETITGWGLRAGFAARPGTRVAGDAAFSGAIPAWWPDQTISLLALPGVVHTFMMERTHGRDDLLAPETLRVPVLILHGDDDRLVPFAIAEDAARRIARARLLLVAGGSHGLPNTHADWMAEQIDAFARE